MYQYFEIIDAAFSNSINERNTCTILKKEPVLIGTAEVPTTKKSVPREHGRCQNNSNPIPIISPLSSSIPCYLYLNSLKVAEFKRQERPTEKTGGFIFRCPWAQPVNPTWLSRGQSKVPAFMCLVKGQGGQELLSRQKGDKSSLSSVKFCVLVALLISSQDAMGKGDNKISITAAFICVRVKKRSYREGEV